MFVTQRGVPGPVWLHFLVLGAVLHGLMLWQFPPPQPILGPPDPTRLQQRLEQYQREAGKPPDSGVRERLVDIELREELLFRMALEAGLHFGDPVVKQRIVMNMRFLDPTDDRPLDALVASGFGYNMHVTDEVIRRRLIQVMEQVLLAGINRSPIADADLRAAFAATPAEFQVPARVSFDQVYLGEPDSDVAQSLFAQIAGGPMPLADALALGRPLLVGNSFDQLDWPGVASRFGENFVGQMQAVLDSPDQADVDQTDGDQTGWYQTNGATSPWLGPIESVFGSHAVRLRGYTPQRQQTFDEARTAIRSRLEAEAEQEAMAAVVDAAMTEFEVRRR